MLINLLSNAAKFTTEGDVRLVVSAVGAGIEFAVSDTPVGMDADDLDRIFRPFEQVDPTSTRRAQGAGLGLAISRHLAVAMGGTLEVESTLGVGSTFRFTLPRA